MANRMGRMLDEVKAAETRRSAEQEKLSKLRKDLENLRDHAKTIFKVAAVPFLVPFPDLPYRWPPPIG